MEGIRIENVGIFREGIRLENVGIFYGHLEYFKTDWYILRSFGTFFPALVHFFPLWYIFSRFGTFFPALVHFFPLWYILPRKIWQPRTESDVDDIEFLMETRASFFPIKPDGTATTAPVCDNTSNCQHEGKNYDQGDLGSIKHPLVVNVDQMEQNCIITAKLCSYVVNVGSM
jgi:hypothetical protein